MPDYRRAFTPGGTYFFTVVTDRRRPILCDPPVRAALREALRSVRAAHPFDIDSWVLLPDHLHCIWVLPDGDTAFPRRWAMVKRAVTQRCGSSLHVESWATPSKRRRHESTLWQRRYWEHQIRDAGDLNRHRDYLHWNPVKHGYVSRVSDWPYSTFHRFVRQEHYAPDWGGGQGLGAGSAFGE
jgi:putative transposase